VVLFNTVMADFREEFPVEFLAGGSSINHFDSGIGPIRGCRKASILRHFHATSLSKKSCHTFEKTRDAESETTLGDAR
jgi:hypothetical protein